MTQLFPQNPLLNSARNLVNNSKKVLALQAAGKHNTRLATSHHRRPSRSCF